MVCASTVDYALRRVHRSLAHGSVSVIQVDVCIPSNDSNRNTETKTELNDDAKTIHRSSVDIFHLNDNLIQPIISPSLVLQSCRRFANPNPGSFTIRNASQGAAVSHRLPVPCAFLCLTTSTMPTSNNCMGQN